MSGRNPNVLLRRWPIFHGCPSSIPRPQVVDLPRLPELRSKAGVTSQDNESHSGPAGRIDSAAGSALAVGEGLLSLQSPRSLAQRRPQEKVTLAVTRRPQTSLPVCPRPLPPAHRRPRPGQDQASTQPWSRARCTFRPHLSTLRPQQRQNSGPSLPLGL